MQQQVAEITGVQRAQARLIGGIKLAALSVGKGAGVAFRNVRRRQPLVLPAVDHPGELFGRPALVVEALGLDQLLDQPDHVVGIRSEEHTSELQSLMRISYAVFCLKKKKQQEQPS